MKTIVYYNPYIEVDVTVLKYLSRYYHIIWFPVIYNNGCDIYTEEELHKYAADYGIEIHIVSISWRRRSFRQFMTEYKLIRYIKAINPDLIFTCNRDLYYTILAFFFLPKKIVLLGIHDYKLHSNFETNVFLRFSYWLSFHIYDNFLLYSKNQYDMFLKNYSYKNCFQTYLAAKNY